MLCAMGATGCPVVTILAVQFVTNCWGFSVSPQLAISSPLLGRVRGTARGGLGDGDGGYVNDRTIRRRSQLFASKSSPPLPSTDDPFELLGLDPRNPTTDAKEIKRAYRKRAMQYHPDVLLGPDSTEKERDEASKNFARINGAYEILTGGNKGSNASSSTSSSPSSSGAYSTYNKPPHRRPSNASGNYRSTNWEDFMPNYDDEDAKYDAGGDSFGAIFSDALTGAAGYASGVVGGGGGIVGDFIEFLENMDGFQSGFDDDDKTLRDLIAFGSYDEVSSEMDECDILVSSLEKKLSTVENELIQAQADLNAATRYSERLDIDERIAELKAREKVVKGYVKKTKKRLISLRERYKEMVVEGRGGRGYGSSSASSRSSQSSYSDSAYTPPQPSYSPPAASPTSSSSSTSRRSTSSNSWRNEGFSGSRRSSRSRSSRRGREREAGSPSSQEQQQSSSGPSRSGGYSSSRSSNESSSSSGSGSARSTPQNYEPYVPPHRRSRSSTNTAAQEKKRLRELEVDDEFDKLKREMGL